MKPASREDVIELLIRQEELIGEFYRACAGQFPEKNDLWLSMACVENEHARILRGVAADSSEGRAFAARRNFALGPLQIMLEFIKKQTATLASHRSALITALAGARDIETPSLKRRG